MNEFSKMVLAPVVMDYKDGLFHIEADMVFEPKEFEADSFQVFTPILYTEEQHLKLDSVAIAGRNCYWSFYNPFKRIRKSYHLCKILLGRKNRLVNYYYKVALPYEPWMEYADLRFI